MKHFYQDIPWQHFDFADLYARLVREAPDPAHFVEVGAWLGKSTACLAVEIANGGKTIRLIVVDTWQGSPAESDMVEYARTHDVYAEFLANVAPVRHLLYPVRMASVDAAHLFADASLDLVFIDASHDRASVAADLAAWWPKTKPGGILAGHDYDLGHPGVMAAVAAFFPAGVEVVGNCWIQRKAP